MFFFCDMCCLQVSNALTAERFELNMRLTKVTLNRESIYLIPVTLIEACYHHDRLIITSCFTYNHGAKSVLAFYCKKPTTHKSTINIKQTEEKKSIFTKAGCGFKPRQRTTTEEKGVCVRSPPLISTHFCIPPKCQKHMYHLP